jgi:hypothetical protein
MTIIINSVAWVCERTIPTERPPLVGEVSANLCGQRVPRGKRYGSLRSYSWFSRPEPLLFLSSSSSIALTRLSGPRFRHTIFQKIWQSRETNPDLWICSQELWPLDHRGDPMIINILKNYYIYTHIYRWDERIVLNSCNPSGRTRPWGLFNL